MHLLAALGLGFDCASQPEISSILSLPIPVDPSRIIYANPCKAPSFIRHAAANGVDYMTFDNSDELQKVRKYHPNAKMVLRILTDDSGSLCRLGLKFGAPLSEVRALLQKAKALDIIVKGISFHCGSGCTNPALFGDAVRRAKWAFEVGAEEGHDFDFLDIGGGFEDDNFESIAHVLRGAIEEHFPLEGAGAGVRIIAEPGRYYVSRAFELATNIIARRAAHEGADGEMEAVSCEMAMEMAEEEKPTVMCAFIFFEYDCARADIARNDRLHQRRCVRRVQLYPLRSSSRPAARPHSFGRVPPFALVREHRVGPLLRVGTDL